MYANNQSRPSEGIEHARQLLKENQVVPIVGHCEGPIVELVNHEEKLSFFRWESCEQYISCEQPTIIPIDQVDDSIERANAGIWLFGPERVPEPAVAYRALAQMLAKDATIVMASESPWPGKILASDEFGEYTREETVAALVRSGFDRIDQLKEGPFYRCWQAKRTAGVSHLALVEAEQYLSAGYWQNAQKSLEKVVDQLNSLDAVREYALLVAACHDTAGRLELCLDALSDALQLDKTCARALCGLGRVAALQGELHAAGEFFEAALAQEPALVAALHGLGIVHEAQGDLVNAFESMMIASDLRPADDNLMVEVVRIGNAAGKLTEVTRFLDHSITSRPLAPLVAEVVQSLHDGPNMALNAQSIN